MPVYARDELVGIAVTGEATGRAARHMALLALFVMMVIHWTAVSANAAGTILPETSLGLVSTEGPATITKAGSTVVRQRRAHLDADQVLRLRSSPSLELSLFDDLKLRAVLEKIQSGRNGAYILSGKVDDTDGGRLVLAVRGAKVYASIYVGNRVFQIRPLEGDDSLIRELDPDRIERPLRRLGKRSAWQVLLPVDSKIIELVNLERSAEGIPVLAHNEKLSMTAMDHVREMALYDYSSHDRRDGRKFWQSVFDSGYPISKCGENIAVGLSSPEETFEALVSSPDHRVNMMDPEFTEIGTAHLVRPAAGAQRHFWAQEFGAGHSWQANSGIEGLRN